MANIKSQIKRNRQNEQKRLANKAVRKIDRAAAKGVIHKNQASNRKSRLMKRVQKTSAS